MRLGAERHLLARHGERSRELSADAQIQAEAEHACSVW
jgi:hypothetical protein